MTIQAQWNNELFGRLPSSLKALESFEISCGVETEEKESSNGVKKTVVKGLSSEKLKVSYTAGFAVGTDPRQEFEHLKKVASKGELDHFYLGSEKVGRNEFMIEQVDLSDVTKDNTGRFYSGKITINFGDNTNNSASKTKSSSSSKSGGLKLTAQDYENARKLVN